MCFIFLLFFGGVGGGEIHGPNHRVDCLLLIIDALLIFFTYRLAYLRKKAGTRNGLNGSVADQNYGKVQFFIYI